MSRTRATSVVLKDNNILMIHRFNHGREYWVLPGGGVEEGEEVEKAVLRELEEETTIQAELGENLLEFIDGRGDKHFLFLCRYVSGEPKLHQDSPETNTKDTEQSYAPCWVEISKIPGLTIYPTEEKSFLMGYLKLNS